MKRKRGESFYIPDEKIQEYKREFIPTSREITRIEEEPEDEAIEIEKERVDLEFAMLARMVGEELDNKEGCERKKHKVESSDEKDLAEEKDEFYEVGMGWQNNQVNETGDGIGNEEMVVRTNIEFAGLSCSSSSSSSSSSSPVVDIK